MANSVATTNEISNAVTTVGVVNPFEAYSQAVNRNRIVGDLLKFSKGDYTAGQNDDEIPIGTRVVAVMGELMTGWVKWEEGKPVDMQMGKISDCYVPARRSDLDAQDKELWDLDNEGNPRDPWQLTNYAILTGVDDKGKVTDKLYTFATSSKGGIGAIGKLCGAYGKQMRMKPDEYPVIELGVGKYKHPKKELGWIKFPEFKIVGWVKKADVDAVLSAEAAAAEAAAANASNDEDPPF